MRYVSSKAVSRALGAALLVGALGACDFIEPTSFDPNAVPSATIDQLFTGVQVNTWFFAEGQISRLSSLWTQQMTGTDRQFTSLDNYIFNEQSADGEFQAIYTGGGLVDLATAIADAEEGGRRTVAGILKIHEAYLVGMGASIWGDIPYSEATNGDIAEPALDDQADVYATVQALLTEAIGDLAAGGDPIPVGGVDMSFGGDADAWTAVAHTLKARFYLHWAESSTGNYAQALSEAESGIQSVSHNWEAVHTATATENNAWYQFLRDRAGYISSGDYLLPMMRDDNDARLSIYYGLAPGGGYSSPEEVGPTNASGMNEADGRGSPAAEFPLVTCAENYFIIAEAEHSISNFGDAIDAAKDALGCQEDYYGVDLSPQMAAFDGLTGDALLGQIMDQKYTALFLNPETWNDYKRTCYPELTPRVEQGMPARLFYGLTERQTNTNIPEPAAQAGGHGYKAGNNDNDPTGCGG